MKSIMPWNIKPGMKTQLVYPGGLKVVRTVKAVFKRPATFCRGNIWRVVFQEDNDFLNYFGKSGNLPPEKFHVYEEKHEA